MIVMPLLIAALALSLVPAFILYFLLKKRKRDDKNYTDTCRDALLKGIKCSFYIILLSMLFSLTESLTGLREYPVPCAVFHNFITLAFAEECVKILTFRKILKQVTFPYSGPDAVAWMTLVGLGFELIESVIYGIGTNAGQMLVRGLTMMHAGYGFITGYFTAKAMETGKKHYLAAAFLIPWILHGSYDLTLKDVILALNENIVFIPVTLALFSAVILVLMYFYFRKDRKQRAAAAE